MHPYSFVSRMTKRMTSQQTSVRLISLSINAASCLRRRFNFPWVSIEAVSQLINNQVFNLYTKFFYSFFNLQII